MARETFRLQTAGGDVIAANVRVADSFGTRFMGLMGRKSLDPGEGLCIQRCTSIHMFFMRMAIDVAFVDRDGRVLHILNSIRPWRVSRVVRGSKAAIELPAGLLAQHGVEKGAVLSLESNGVPPKVTRKSR
jgi:uncharacterized membrane protein (UPF0127 family)